MKIYKILFGLTLLFAGCSSLSLLLLTIVEREQHLVLINALAIAFWSGLLLEFILFVVLAIGLKHNYKKDYKKVNDKKLIGLVSFCQNKIAIGFDVLTFIALILIAVLTIMKIYNGAVLVCSIFVFCLSFNMRCLFNGKVYRFLSTKNYKE